MKPHVAVDLIQTCAGCLRMPGKWVSLLVELGDPVRIVLRCVCGRDIVEQVPRPCGACRGSGTVPVVEYRGVVAHPRLTGASVRCGACGGSGLARSR